MKSVFAIIAVTALSISFSPHVTAQTAPPTGGATRSTAPTQQPKKGMAGKKRMMTTCTPRQKCPERPAHNNTEAAAASLDSRWRAIRLCFWISKRMVTVGADLGVGRREAAGNGKGFLIARSPSRPAGSRWQAASSGGLNSGDGGVS